MPTLNKVVWEQGMFIHPQHFQQQDRHFERLLINYNNTLAAYFFGLTSFSLDEQLLHIGRVAISTAKGILPDGVYFDVALQNISPKPLIIPPNTRDELIYLALPLSQLGIENITSDVNQLARYLSTKLDVLDATASNGNTISMTLAQLNLRLMLDSEDRREFSCMPVAKVREITNESKIILDSEFIPPCLDLQVSQKLVSYLHEISSLVIHRAEILSKRMGDINRSNSAVADFLMLQLLNRFDPILKFMQTKLCLHPEVFYQVLIQFAGELATFSHANKRPQDFGLYDHTHLQQTFAPVISALRYSLSKVMEQPAFALPLEKREYGLLVAALADSSLLTDSSFVLAAYATLPAEILLARLPAQIKISAMEHIHKLITAQLPGVTLKILASAPPQIPYNTGYSYFKLEFSPTEIAQLHQSGSIAVQVAGEFPDLKLELWVIREN